MLVTAAPAHHVRRTAHPHEPDARTPGQRMLAIAPDDLDRTGFGRTMEQPVIGPLQPDQGLKPLIAVHERQHELAAVIAPEGGARCGLLVGMRWQGKRESEEGKRPKPSSRSFHPGQNGAPFFCEDM